MYAPPHEFGVNPPAVFAEVRRASYESFTMRNLFGSVLRPKLMNRKRSAFFIFNVVVAILAVLVCVGLNQGLNALYQQMTPVGSPYAILTYRSIVLVSIVLFGLSLAAMGLGVGAYWRSTRGSYTGLFNPRAWMRALRYGATLRYLRGGAEGCYVKENHASSERRMLHYFVSYGFMLCLVATIAAGVEQDLMGRQPPFALVSVPVLCGLIGGAGLVLGSIGLLRLKSTQDVIATDGQMTAMDLGFLIALVLLGATGLSTFMVRSGPDYGLVLAIHLAVVWSCFLLAPMTKFVHFVYRLLALVQDNLEIEHGVTTH
jgi:citrate/tricarballylate utilization protein